MSPNIIWFCWHLHTFLSFLSFQYWHISSEFLNVFSEVSNLRMYSAMYITVCRNSMPHFSGGLIKLKIYLRKKISNLAVPAELNVGTTSNSLTGRYKVALFHEMADILSTMVWFSCISGNNSVGPPCTENLHLALLFLSSATLAKLLRHWNY